MNKKPTNWIHGLSVEERKKQGITTVEPPKKTDKKIHYNVGQVDVEVNHSHMNKLRILKMTMENWAHDDGKNNALDSAQGRMYEADLHKVNELMDKGKLLPITPQENFLTKEEKIELNFIFKYYGGIRKQGWTK